MYDILSKYTSLSPILYLFSRKSLCWGKIIEILLNKDFVFSIFKPRKFFYKEEFF